VGYSRLSGMIMVRMFRFQLRQSGNLALRHRRPLNYRRLQMLLPRSHAFRIA
jgi:hypothetical protein